MWLGPARKLALPTGLFICYTKIMARQEIPESKKPRGRPTGRVKPETKPVRLTLDTLAALDVWIANQPEPRPSRPEAIRCLLEKALGAGDAGAFIPIEDVTSENDE